MRCGRGWVGSENVRKGFLGFLQRRSGSLAEVEAEDGGARARGMKGKHGVEVEQLCLEVAPSILIDFICAHVSERANEPRHGKRERVKGGGKRGVGRIERQTEAMRGCW